MSGIQGAWPGGPRRAENRAAPRRAWRLDSLETRADRAADGRRAHRKSQRGRRIVSTLVVAGVCAGGVGFVLGRGAARTTDQVTADLESSAVPESDISRIIAGEGRRVVRNMWLSEILEQQR